MVARKFQVQHGDNNYDVDYNTDDGLEVFRFHLFSLTSIPPDNQKILGVEDDRTVLIDSDLAASSEKLRLVSISEDEKEEENEESSIGSESELLLSDEEFAPMLQAEEDSLFLQQYAAAEDNGLFEGRLRPYVDQVRMYEDPVRQEAARKTVPIEELNEKALVSLAKEGNFSPSKTEQEHAFLLQLLFWFNQSFGWVYEPSCEGCGNETILQGMGAPLPSEICFGASQVEVYGCNVCKRITRFPRYNDPMKLVETRKGRCGEWANCFTLYCRAFGYESRLILDFTDHVWTECFSPYLERWMHLDPCGGGYDKPLLYESGWNKKLNYVFAFAKDGVHDVIKRYKRKWHEVLSRRNLITEIALSTLLINIRKECRRGFTTQEVSVLEDRDEKEQEELERDLHSKEEASISLPGRQSGDKEWRRLRLEVRSDEDCSLSCSSCPVRVCIDEHVTRTYDAFLPVLSYFLKEELSQSTAVEVLEKISGILKDLQKSPFRNRRTSLDSVLNGNATFLHKLLPSSDELLNALSLRKVETDGRVDILLAGDPVKTSLALPVALDALDDTFHNLKSCDGFDKESLSLPLLKLNRIHSGSVLASGEEIPFGIVSFCRELVTNNLPNKQLDFRWNAKLPNLLPELGVLEGSDDGVSSWHILDKQTSQIFEGRFLHKTYKVASVDLVSSVFRFKFLAVRDVKSTLRLQVGSINLYSMSS